MKRHGHGDMVCKFPINVTVPSSILLRNVYGWFTRVERGVYTLTPEGIAALARWPQPVMAAVTSAGSRIQHRQHSAVPT